jgi:hypothetical protein
MPQSESLPWLVVVGAVCIVFAIFLEAVLIQPLFDTLTGLSSWQNTSVTYINEGQRMTADFINYLILIVVSGISFGVFLSARRGL